MRSIAVFIPIGFLTLAVILAGCTSSSPAVPVQTTAVPATAVTTIPTPTATPVPFPNALALNAYGSFGSGEKTGKAAVYKYLVRPNYTWTAPSYNSAHEQSVYNQPNDIQYGYNIQKPADGNVFLFVYLHVVNTGTSAVNAPSAKQFTVNINNVAYSYSPVSSSDTVVNNIDGTQYDFSFGSGNTVGYVLPGESNAADGYLIYEVPASFTPEKTFVVGNLDFQTQAVWKLG